MCRSPNFENWQISNHYSNLSISCMRDLLMAVIDLILSQNPENGEK